ncbi:DUF1569 domain-containing protein [Algibacter amylolyticus]|uniref:DUF1569 domain-containing protein n=1 Tax=Algibacter amylolyticus TaxID=1608400 RepID=A0A5M7BG53_9FLAO|nr:DUF1569 domain-containing protein [Algibacter amylolyticus]KAA5827820.1 DUF1569 domain-containing protein [Algibacter amylolyticus]MBB5267049.1 hypothetical protein [Algibacter amylolyticus]TSJ82065.1 DUF1569 domain-containing protein [Algibacter amylolyticus]
MADKSINKLTAQLAKIEGLIPKKEVKNPSVSKASIGWQLDHALKVFNAVSEWTENSNPNEYQYKFNLMRTVLFPLGYFPRGKVKAPKYVIPPEIINVEDLKSQIQTAKSHIEKLQVLPKNAFYKHFIFGKLPKTKTLRFLYMHTNHHLKIVNDILNK